MGTGVGARVAAWLVTACLGALAACSAPAAIEPTRPPTAAARVAGPGVTATPSERAVAFLQSSSQVYTSGSGVLYVDGGPVPLVRVTDGEVTPDGAVGILLMSAAGDGLFIAGRVRPGVQRTSAQALHVVAVTKGSGGINTDSGDGECVLRLRQADVSAVAGLVTCRDVPDAGGGLVSYHGRFAARSTTG